MNNNVILSLDMALLLEYSQKDPESACIIADEVITKRAIRESNAKRLVLEGDYKSLLYDQIEKYLARTNKEIKVSDILFILEFEKCNEGHYKTLALYPKGIKISLNGKDITIVDFLKSNSMSKDSRMYYIDSTYYKDINECVNFGITFNKEIDIAKWFAYTGLAVTDCYITNGIKFNSEEVVIVPDKNASIDCDAVTAISIPLLFEDIDDILNNKDNIKSTTFKTIRKKYECYKNSPDFINLENEFKDIILTICNSTIDEEYFINIKQLKTRYSKHNNIKDKIAWRSLKVNNFPTEVNYYDGEGLISLELERQINEELRGKAISFVNEEESFDDSSLGEPETAASDYYHSFQIRLPFTKGVVHSCDLQTFFKEHGIKTIRGKTFSHDKEKSIRQYDVTKVKMILTASQFKLSKFIDRLPLLDGETPIDAYFRLLNQYEFPLGISNVDNFKEKDYVKLCYQFFSTMPFDGYNGTEIIASNKDYIDRCTTDEAIIEMIAASASTNKVHKNVMEIYKISPEFVYNSKFFRNYKKKVYDNEVSKTHVSKMSVLGTRKYLAADLYGLLCHSVGIKIPSTEYFPLNRFYMPNTEYEYNHVPFALLRNPHYSRNEIKMLKPWTKVSEERSKYFGHLTGVIMVNPEGLTADRLGGADYDGDTVIITWQPGLIRTLYKNLYKDKKEIYPLAKIPSISSKKVENNHFQRVKCMYNTFETRVGQISDACFKWANYAYNNDDEDSDSVAIYTILSGLEIDSVKNGRKPQLLKVIGKNPEVKLFLDIKNAYKKGEDYSTYLIEAGGYNSTIFNNINSAKKYSLVKTNHPIPTIKENKDLSVEDAVMIAAIVNSYSALKDQLRIIRNLKKKVTGINILELTKDAERIISLKKHNILFEMLTEYCKTENPYRTLYQYLIDRTYFMKDDREKLEELEKLGLGHLPDRIKDILIDYSEEGFKLLYLVLYYLKELGSLFFDFDDRKIEAKEQGIFIKTDMDKAIRSLSRKYGSDFVQKVGERSLKIFDVFAKIVEETIPKDLDITCDIASYLNSLEDKAISYLRRLASTYTFSDVARVVLVYNTGSVFSIFYKQLKNYLELGGN